MTPPAAAGGLLASLRRLIDTGLGIAQLRLELLGTEFEQEKLRVYSAVLHAAVGLMLLGMALVLLLGLVLLLVWDGYRLQALALMTILSGAAAAWMLVTARRRLRAPEGGPFALNLGELRRDRESLDAVPASSQPNRE